AGSGVQTTHASISGSERRSWPSAPQDWPTRGCPSASPGISRPGMAEIVLALDLPDVDAALRLLDQLPELRWVKVGPVLLTRAGAPFVQQLAARRLRVFLDLKWHDIPNTVAGAVSAARDLGVAMATVHTLGGSGMLEAAAKAGGGAVALVGVTVLTSHDATTYAGAVGRSAVTLDEEVVRLAALARGAGLQGVVCSPQETALVRREW